MTHTAKHATMRRLLTGLAALTTACSEGAQVTAPASSAPSYGKARVTPSQGPGADTTVVRFTVEPSRQTTATFGVHKIIFSGQSICDPATSGYGAGSWETPCEPAAGPITITAKSWTDEAGRPHVDFQPALRFSPDDRRPVTLYLTDREAAGDALSTIVYCTDARTCIDEARTDPELATRHIGTGGMLARRVKHFSGYQIILGREGGEESADGGY